MAITRAMARRTKRIRAKPAYGQFVALHGVENHERARDKAHKLVLFNKNKAAAAAGPLQKMNASMPDMTYWNQLHQFHMLNAPSMTMAGKNEHYTRAHRKLVRDLHHKKKAVKTYRKRVTLQKKAVKTAEDNIVMNIAQLVQLSQSESVMG